MSGSDRSPARQVRPVSADDVARVVTRALSERPWRLRLTAGQRLNILRSPRHQAPGAAQG